MGWEWGYLGKDQWSGWDRMAVGGVSLDVSRVYLYRCIHSANQELAELLQGSAYVILRLRSPAYFGPAMPCTKAS